MKAGCRILISGRVQGVFFRENAVATAKRLGIKGWVRNREDGTVEIVAEGAKARMRQFIEWCNKGPPEAKVDNVDVKDHAPTGEFSGFEMVGKN